MAAPTKHAEQANARYRTADGTAANGGDAAPAAPSGGELPAATKLGCVRLQVASMECSLAFYRDVLGMRVLGRDGNHAVLGPDGEDVPLVELWESPGATPVPPGGRLGLYHFAILLPTRAALARFAHHLRAVGVRAGGSDHRVSEALYLRDPDGLGVEVYADRPRNLWREHNGEVVMATEPLRMAELLHAADNEGWSGLPTGARIGHVHLHVGDLARADGFYHRHLGFARRLTTYPGALFLAAGGYHHHLGLNTWATGAVPPRAADARLVEWELLLPPAAAEAALTRLAAAQAPMQPGTGGGTTVHDPWGTAVHIRSTKA